MKEKQSYHPPATPILLSKKLRVTPKGDQGGSIKGVRLYWLAAYTPAAACWVSSRACKWNLRGYSLLHVSSCHLLLRHERVGLCIVHDQDKVPISSTRPIQSHFSSYQHTAEGLPTQKRPLKLTVLPMAETHKRKRNRLRISEWAIKWKPLQPS